MITAKPFIITVDTEGDNLWDHQLGEEVHTDNALFIPRFQELCECFQFKPVYLLTYEMASCDFLMDYLRQKAHAGNCEIGIHIHAWNNPPYFPLEAKYSGLPYLIEYPLDIMKKKFEATYSLIAETTGIEVFSHRAGRWAMNSDYFKLLEEYGVLVDCSFTPTVTWNRSPGMTMGKGPDYSKVPQQSHFIGKVLEVPMSIVRSRIQTKGSLRSCISTLIKGKPIWLRPSISSISEMKKLCYQIHASSSHHYAEFMIHSSELMPGGSPYFTDNKSIEGLYEAMASLFQFATDHSFYGATLKEFYATNNS